MSAYKDEKSGKWLHHSITKIGTDRAERSRKEGLKRRKRQLLTREISR